MKNITHPFSWYMWLKSTFLAVLFWLKLILSRKYENQVYVNKWYKIKKIYCFSVMRKSKTNITLNRQRNLLRYILTFLIELKQQSGNILSSRLLYNHSCKALHGDIRAFIYYGINQSFGRTIGRCFKYGFYCGELAAVMFSYFFVTTKSCTRCIPTLADCIQGIRGVINKIFQNLGSWKNNNNNFFLKKKFIVPMCMFEVDKGRSLRDLREQVNKGHDKKLPSWLGH